MLRKDGYFQKQFTQFWVDRVNQFKSTPLIIAGLGFDPRSMQSAKILYNNQIETKVLPIKFSVLSSGANGNAIEKANEKNFRLLKQFNAVCEPIEVDMFDTQNRPIGGRQIVQSIYGKQKHIKNVDDIILDIGGLPRPLFAPLLCYLMNKQAELGFKNLHVASLPNELLDKEIKSGQILEPKYIYGFKMPKDDDKIVWIPIIGKNDPDRLRKIHSKIEKNCIEICPIFTFRSRNPKLVDELIVNLRHLLFQEIKTFNTNIIYVGHESPFFIYREIIHLSEYYKKLLTDLSDDTIVLITPVDDKTSCVGAIIAAVENNLSIMYADTISYNVENENILLDEINLEPMEIWISGEAYEN